MRIKNLLLLAFGCIILASCKKAEPEIYKPVDTNKTDTTGTDTIDIDTPIVTHPGCNGLPVFKWDVDLAVNTQTIASDTAGNVYIAAYISPYGGIVDVDPGPGVKQLSNGAVIIKLDTSKNLVWATKVASVAGGPLDVFRYFDSPKLQVDDQQNVYLRFGSELRLSGRYSVIVALDASGNVKFETTEGKILAMSAGEANNMYIYDAHTLNVKKINPFTGAVGYERKVMEGGYGYISGSSSGNLYVIGSSTDKNIDFDSGPGTYHITLPDSVTSAYSFLQKFDAAGNLAWVKYIGVNPVTDGKITFDNNENIYITELPNGFYRMIKKLSSAGDLLWQRNIYTFSLPGFDAANNFYALTSDGGRNLGKFDPSGNVLRIQPISKASMAFTNKRDIYMGEGVNLSRYTICN